MAAGRSLEEAMADAARSFYSSAVPPSLEILEKGFEPLPPLAALPCSAAVLATTDSMFGPSPMTILYGILCLEEEVVGLDEDQLSLF
jgi:hypothetical protein